MTDSSLTRRQALARYGGLLSSSPLLLAQQPTGEPPGRIAPVEELVNAFEVEAMAQRKLDPAAYAEIAGSDRKAFDRITFRPRMMVDTRKLDLTVDLFGEKVFAPILIGPASAQKRFHPQGELEMTIGAAAGKALMVVSSRSSYPIKEIAAKANTVLWYQLDQNTSPGNTQEAVQCGCKAVCVTAGPVGFDWRAIDRLRKGISVPVLLKGIISVEEAQAAVQHGAQGIVVSSYRGKLDDGAPASIDRLPAIADAVGAKIPVLIDGSFRRGSDVMKALALGARAVLLARPALWGLAAYGAAGVQHVFELVQSELARDMAMCGTVNLGVIGRQVVTIHKR